MRLSSQTSPKLHYHVDAYRFVFDALQFVQDRMSRPAARDVDDESSHVSGPELLDGVREYALKRFGLMSRSLFAFWGVTSTDDFGRIVFELIEQGQMRKTDSDELEDFFGVYDFEQALDHDYVIPTDEAFRTPE
ncbi:MAG: hypothetical protein R3C01_13040 [Planctomycetaceae bacterium]